ncbi:Methylated-DNA--protein-cysteine methyltransferase, constitutive [invertebrate metagenome]|uniref:methylated-DNA--[protein]-cysteine S-methyltransferase n=1 Tax=invertebrate metagenome TaxID=1711999 RepID=A0A2H9T8Q1_9ZZZZ
MSIITTCLFHSPIGSLILGAYNRQLCLCDWRKRTHRDSIDNQLKIQLSSHYDDQTVQQHNHSVLVDAKQQLTEYFQGLRQQFTIPLLITGTDFQQKVWKTLAHISFGQTTNYFTLAHRMDHPAAARAVANACGANRLSLFIPCHRVIKANNMPGGYAGSTSAKIWLLRQEKKQINKGKKNLV